MLKPDDPHPCAVGKLEDGSVEYDHDWEFVDDSFDHEYGTEQVHYFACSRCEMTRNVEPGEFDYFDTFEDY